MHLDEAVAVGSFLVCVVCSHLLNRQRHERRIIHDSRFQPSVDERWRRKRINMMKMKKKKNRRRSKSYAWNGDDDDNDTPRAMMIDGRKSGESETRFHDVSEYLSS